MAKILGIESAYTEIREIVTIFEGRKMPILLKETIEDIDRGPVTPKMQAFEEARTYVREVLVPFTEKVSWQDLAQIHSNKDLVVSTKSRE